MNEFDKIVNEMKCKSERVDCSHIYSKSEIKAYRKAVRKRVKIVYNKRIAIRNNKAFVESLIELGELKVEIKPKNQKGENQNGESKN